MSQLIPENGDEDDYSDEEEDEMTTGPLPYDTGAGYYDSRAPYHQPPPPLRQSRAPPPPPPRQQQRYHRQERIPPQQHDPDDGSGGSGGTGSKTILHEATFTIDFDGSLEEIAADKDKTRLVYSIPTSKLVTKITSTSAASASSSGSGDTTAGTGKKKKKKRAGAGSGGKDEGGGGGGDGDTGEKADPTVVTEEMLKRAIVTKLELLGYQNTYPFPCVIKLKGLEGKYGNDDGGILIFGGQTSTTKQDLGYTNYALNPDIVETYGHLTKKDLLEGLVPITKKDFLVPTDHQCLVVIEMNEEKRGVELFSRRIREFEEEEGSGVFEEYYKIRATLVYEANDVLYRKVLQRMPHVDLTNIKAHLSRYTFGDAEGGMKFHSTKYTEVDGVDEAAKARTIFMEKKRFCLAQFKIQFQT